MFNKIKETVTTKLMMLLLGLLGALIGKVLSEIGASSMLSCISDKLSKETLLSMLAISMMIIILEFACIILLYKRLKNKLKPNFGVFWDRKANAYCPACKNLLPPNGKGGLYCIACKMHFYLYDAGNKQLSLASAKKQILS